MTDPAQSEVIALRAQIEEDKIATAEINEIVAKYQADDSALRATVKALRDALEKVRVPLQIQFDLHQRMCEQSGVDITESKAYLVAKDRLDTVRTALELAKEK